MWVIDYDSFEVNLVYSSLYIVLLGIVLSSLKLNIYVYIQADDCGILIRSSRSDTKLFGLKISMLDRLKRALKPNRSKPRISLSQKISLFKFLFHNFKDTSFSTCGMPSKNAFARYRDEQHMTAIFFMTGAKYACNLGQKRSKYAYNDDNNWDLIWMQSKFQRGLNMLAISNSKWTTYACNPFR